MDNDHRDGGGEMDNDHCDGRGRGEMDNDVIGEFSVSRCGAPSPAAAGEGVGG
jgi:hypothetical protein